MSARDSITVALSSTGSAECRSMNGYAMVQGNFEGWAIRVAINSTNHRFLDVKTRIPESLEPFEHQLCQTIRDRIRRGHVDVHILVEPNEDLAVNVNGELLKAYVIAAEDLRKSTGGKTELDTVALLRLPGVIGGTSSVLPETVGGAPSFVVTSRFETPSSLLFIPERQRQAPSYFVSGVITMLR
ncbi:MAG TPA: YicC/YloC family endoribonuclease [Methylomirabilota bacterium]|nr:YicC/YloC family endoribonuclease [Methylomirabilota bacterium]